VRAHGLRWVRYSDSGAIDSADVLLVDTLGDLPGLYQLARVAFVGGSLVNAGGHNVLEPAATGVAVLFGPHTEHFRAPAEALERAGGAWRVHDEAELGRAVEQLLAEEDRRREMVRQAARVVDANRGALERSVGLLLEAMGDPARRSEPGGV
jgi:3-deoxy-D-manno-octulosonic-acid transferase